MQGSHPVRGYSVPEAVATRLPSGQTTISGLSQGGALCCGVGPGASGAGPIAPPPSGSAATVCSVEWLQAQLDQVSSTAIVLNRFLLLGRSERVLGGVQPVPVYNVAHFT